MQPKLVLALSGEARKSVSCEPCCKERRAGNCRRSCGRTLTSLAGGAVLAVLRPVALDHLPLAVVALDGERDAEHVVAGLDDAQDAADSVPLLLGTLTGAQPLHQLVLHDAGAAVEEALHHLEEVGVVLPVYGLAITPPSVAAAASVSPPRSAAHQQGRRTGLRAGQRRRASSDGARGRQELPQATVHGGGYLSCNGTGRSCVGARRSEGEVKALKGVDAAGRGGKAAKGGGGGGGRPVPTRPNGIATGAGRPPSLSLNGPLREGRKQRARPGLARSGTPPAVAQAYPPLATPSFARCEKL